MTLDRTFHLSEPQLVFHELGGEGKGQDPPAWSPTLASVSLFKRNVVLKEGKQASPLPQDLTSSFLIPLVLDTSPSGNFPKPEHHSMSGRNGRGRPEAGVGESMTTPSKPTPPNFADFSKGSSCDLSSLICKMGKTWVV